MPAKKNKVLVAMSGGVDSSTALYRILEQGYDAIGVTMKLWEYQAVGGNPGKHVS
ncbi:MAG: tRNA 2-thiouridine(34) synthase MnmA, partial [Candidatus Marinimicrobia bacterium]|nr:tRNA 2-thiouridine(34) synthase MnmA [Candidatus Neomarinimicrobiota bacterium]